MTLPVFYTQLSLVLTSAMLCVIFYLAWTSLDEKPHALTWSAAFLASAIYWLVILMPGVFPSHESWWLTANVFGFVLITLGLRGHSERTNCSYLPKNLWPYAVVAYGGVVWATAVKPHAGFSVAILPFCALSWNPSQ